ncbi:MAG: dipicolinate synthase subunit DpsA [Acetanaerobacterium sp.]
MTEKFDIAVIGGDARQIYMIHALIAAGYTVICAGLDGTDLDKRAVKTDSLREAVEKSNVVLCPVPLSRGGRDIAVTGADLPDATVDCLLDCLTDRHTLITAAIPARVTAHCAQNGIACHDLMKRDDVAIHNAVATAEGTIAELVARGKTNLHHSRVLVLGFGRCAQVLAKKLAGLDARVCVAARSVQARALAQALGYDALSFEALDAQLSRFDYVVNTVPALVLPRARVALLRDDVVAVDIASNPGGVDFAAAKELGKDAAHCLGLPGRYAPKTSGEILAEAVTTILSERSDSNDAG